MIGVGPDHVRLVSSDITLASTARAVPVTAGHDALTGSFEGGR